METDTFWEKYGVCPNLDEMMKKAKRSGRVKVDTTCSVKTIKSKSKGLQ